MPRMPRGLIRRGSVYYARTYEHGVEKRQSLRTEDCEEAKRRLKQIRRGEPMNDLPEGGSTLGQLGKQWIDSHVAANRSEQNVENARSQFRRFHEKFFGANTPLASIRPMKLDEFKGWLRFQRKANGKPLSAQTQIHILADLCCFLRWCDRNGEAGPKTPPKFVPKAPDLEPKGFTAAEVATLRSLPDEYGFTCRLLLDLGIRWGEAVRAKSEDVRGGCLVIEKTKNKKLRRVPVPPGLLQELLSRRGPLLTFTSPTNFARRVRRRSGIKAFHVHRCRHHHAINWLQRGGNLKALSKALGHSTVQMTERYGKIDDSYVHEEAARVWAS